jgi:hypothetical protein
MEYAAAEPEHDTESRPQFAHEKDHHDIETSSEDTSEDGYRTGTFILP